MIYTINCLSVMLSLILVSCTLAFEYPTNFEEKSYIERFLMHLPGAKDKTLSRLQIERHKLRECEDQKALRRIKLIDQYIEMAVIEDSKCSLESASERTFMIKFHQDQSNSNLMSYLLDCALEQFELCRAKWNAAFIAAIDSLEDNLKVDMQALLDNMMDIKFMRAKKAPKRPYESADLRKVVVAPPPSALLLFMVRVGAIRDVDENIKNHDFNRDNFERIYNTLLISQLSKPICDALSEQTLVYKHLFEPNLEQRRQVRRQVVSVDDYLFEWLAIKMITCAIVRDKHLKENTFLELTSEPETIYNVYSPDDEEFAIFNFKPKTLVN